MDPFELDWGAATIEFYSALHNAAIHLLEHDVKSPVGRARSVRFVGARARWFHRVLPPDCRQQVVYDVREPAEGDDKMEVSNHLIVESPNRIEWPELCRVLSGLRHCTEFFPVPSEEPWERDAVAISVPRKYAGDRPCLQEVLGFVKRLQEGYGVEVFDLRSGRRVDIENVRMIRAAHLDPAQLLSETGMAGRPKTFTLRTCAGSPE
ncbi:MAG TPA: hypothetical protein VF521_00015 [Pyrinomonadaceae bacterium]|jgi:hypothetical protein